MGRQYTYTSSSPFYQHGLNLILAWISNHMPSKVWDDIPYPFPNCNGCTVDLWEWISDFTPHFMMVVTGNDGLQVRFNVLSDKHDSLLTSFLATWNDSYTSGGHESDVIDILHTEVTLNERTYARLLEGHSVSDLKKNVIKIRGSQKACPLFNDILPLIVSNWLKVIVMVIENVNDVYETVIISGNPCYNGVSKCMVCIVHLERLMCAQLISM